MANNQERVTATKAEVRKAAQLTSGVVNLTMSNGASYPQSYWLKSAHIDEAKYIKSFGDATIAKFKKNGKLATIDMVAVYTAKALYQKKTVPASKEELILTDTDGKVLPKKTKAQEKAILEALEAHRCVNPVRKHNDKIEKNQENFGNILGWIDYFFIVEREKNRKGIVTKYDLYATPRGATLREKIGGHGDAHNYLLEHHGKGIVCTGVFYYGDPTKNIHRSGSGDRAFNPDVLPV